MAKNPTMPLSDTPERITFLIVPRFNMATLITMIEPLRIANYLSPQPLFQWEILSQDGNQIPASNGLTIAAAPPTDQNRRGEVVFVLASWGGESYANRDTLAWLRRRSREGARICPVELGSYLVAKAGLLSGQPTAVHWSWAPGFQEQFATIPVVEQLFTYGEKAITCAGGLAGVDLMLHLIADRHGDQMATEVADQMLHNALRPPSAPQRRTLSQGAEPMPPLMRDAIALIEQNIAEPFSVPHIAAALGVSQRQLERQFRHNIGCTVVQYGALCRLQHARVLLISTKLSVRDIAAATGFNTLSHFAHAFGKTFGRRPSDYRQGWPAGDAAPSWPGTLAAFLETLPHRGPVFKRNPP